MGKYKNKTFTLRIENTLQDKVKIIAQKEDRPITSQYEKIVREYIQTYESVHSPIPLEHEGGGVINNILHSKRGGESRVIRLPPYYLLSIVA